MPMNSVTTLPKLVIRMPIIMKKGDPEAEFFADQVAQALAGDRAHAGAHFLHHDQGERDRDHGPQQKMSELCAGVRVGEDAAGIVVDVRGNKARADDGEEQQDPGFPTFQKFHAHDFADIGSGAIERRTTPQDKRMQRSLTKRKVQCRWN